MPGDRDNAAEERRATGTLPCGASAVWPWCHLGPRTRGGTFGESRRVSQVCCRSGSWVPGVPSSRDPVARARQVRQAGHRRPAGPQAYLAIRRGPGGRGRPDWGTGWVRSRDPGRMERRGSGRLAWRSKGGSPAPGATRPARSAREPAASTCSLPVPDNQGPPAPRGGRALSLRLSVQE